MPTVGTLKLDLIIDGKKAEVTIERVEGDFDKLESKSKQTGQSLINSFSKAKVAALAVAAGIAAIVKGLNSAVEVASEFEEANSKMLTVFSLVPDQARDMRDELVNAYSFSTREATKLLAATGDLLTGLGMQQEVAAELSFQTQTLAADLASFTNAQGGAQAVSEALTRAMLGERESLKTYGIAISEADVQQKLLAEGKENLTGLALRQAKAEATLTLAMEQSKNAIGDLERTQNSYANTQRRVNAMMDDIVLEIGQSFLPVWQSVLEAIDKFMNKLEPGEFAGRLNAIWQTFVELGKRLMTYWSGLWHVLSGILKQDQGEYMQGLAEVGSAIALGWEDTVDRIKAAYKDGQEAFLEFRRGTVSESARLRAQEEQEEQAAANKAAQLALNVNAKMIQLASDRTSKIVALTEEEITAHNNAVKKKILGEQKLTEERENLALQNTQNLSSMLTFGLGMARNVSKQMFSIWKGAAYAKTIVDTYAAAQASAKMGMPWAIPFIAAALAQGFARAAAIARTEFRPMAVGGLIEEPTLALMGEAGTEVVAPKEDFLSVVNSMARTGEIQGGVQLTPNMISRAVEAGVSEALSSVRWNLDLTAEDLALVVEQGKIPLERAEF